MSAIFGGSKQSSKSSSVNQAYPYLQGAYSGQVSNGTHANDALYSLLTGGAGSADAFNNYKNSAGFQSTLDAGSHAITGNAASRGLMNSGATGKALVNYGQSTNQQYYKDYLSQLLGLSQAGTQAGGLIAGAGQTSQSSSSGSSKPGIGGFLGALASGAASDPRLKMDVTKVGEASNGLGIYDFHYIWDADDAPLTRGYMADEVAEIAPEALGSPLAGEFMTVRYDLLPPIKGE